MSKMSEKDIDRIEGGGKEPVEHEYSASFRFPTADYAYMEIEAYGTQESLISQYNAFERALKVGQGLETKEWNKMVDEYRKGKGMSVETMERMDKAQSWFIHELDKSNNRINNKKVV